MATTNPEPPTERHAHTDPSGGIVNPSAATRPATRGSGVPAIRVEGLTKDFGDQRAVDQLSFEIPAGGVTGFVGPNGAGKSTTFRMLLGLIRPTAGAAWMLGEPIDDPHSEELGPLVIDWDSMHDQRNEADAQTQLDLLFA